MCETRRREDRLVLLRGRFETRMYFVTSAVSIFIDGLAEEVKKVGGASMES